MLEEFTVLEVLNDYYYKLNLRIVIIRVISNCNLQLLLVSCGKFESCPVTIRNETKRF